MNNDVCFSSAFHFKGSPNAVTLRSRALVSHCHHKGGLWQPLERPQRPHTHFLAKVAGVSEGGLWQDAGLSPAEPSTMSPAPRAQRHAVPPASRPWSSCRGLCIAPKYRSLSSSSSSRPRAAQGLDNPSGLKSHRLWCESPGCQKPFSFKFVLRFLQPSRCSGAAGSPLPRCSRAHRVPQAASPPVPASPLAGTPQLPHPAHQLHSDLLPPWRWWPPWPELSPQLTHQSRCKTKPKTLIESLRFENKPLEGFEM